MVDQTSVVNEELWRAGTNIDNYLIAGVAIIFVIFSLNQNKIAALHAASLPLLALLLARKLAAEKATRFSGTACLRRFSLSRDCSYCSTGRCPILSRVSALSGIPRLPAIRYGIRRGRLQ